MGCVPQGGSGFSLGRLVPSKSDPCARASPDPPLRTPCEFFAVLCLSGCCTRPWQTAYEVLWGSGQPWTCLTSLFTNWGREVSPAIPTSPVTPGREEVETRWQARGLQSTWRGAPARAAGPPLRSACWQGAFVIDGSQRTQALRCVTRGHFHWQRNAGGNFLGGLSRDPSPSPSCSEPFCADLFSLCSFCS